MNNILCKDHPDNQIIFIIWKSKIVKFVCDECMATDLQEGDSKEEKWKKLAIRKAFKEPEYFLNQFSLDEKSKLFLSTYKKFSEVELKDIIQKTEQHIKEIQLIVDKIIDELKQEVIKLINDVDFHRNQLNKVLQYQEFKELIENLNNSTQTVTHDVVKQIEIKIEKIFLDIEQNSSSLNKEIKKVFSEIPKTVRMNAFPGIEQLKLQIQQFQQLSIFKFSGQKPFVPQEYFQYLQNKISLDANKQIRSANLIFNLYKDNLNQVNFWSCVKNKENLLMIFKSQSGNIFGAYTPLKWVYKDEDIDDPSVNTFLFSYTHNSIHGRPNNNNGYTLNLNRNKGPCFGSDIYIEGDFQNGSSNLGNGYTKESSQDSQTHLFGQKTPNIIQCQIYQIIFK